MLTPFLPAPDDHFLAAAEGQRLSDEELHALTKRTLDTCYSIGGSYADEMVREVAKVRAKEL